MTIRSAAGVLSAGILALVLSACGSDAASDTSSTGDPDAVDTFIPVGKTSGEPVKVGYINMEGGAAGSFPDVRRSAEVAVDYLNEHGGIDGHPIELVTCESQGSAESSQACAQKIVDAKPVSVMFGVDHFASGAIPVIEASGLPIVGALPTTDADLKLKNAYYFNGGSPGAYTAMSAFTVETLKPEKVAIFYVNVPAGKQAAEDMAAPILEDAGIEVETVPVTPGAPDLSPTASKALSGDPDVVMFATDASTCGKLNRALAQLGFDGEKVHPSSCADEKVFADNGDAMDGYYQTYWYLPTAPDAAPAEARAGIDLYNNAFARYDPEAEKTGLGLNSFNDVFGLADAYNQIGYANLSPESIADFFQTGGTGRLPNGPDYACGREGTFAGVCQPTAVVYKREASKVVGYQGDYVNGIELLK